MNILITGAARGIGHELARRALARGDTVFAAVRNPADKTRFGDAPNLRIVIMEVSDTASVERAFQDVDRELAGAPLHAVIHSAAISLPGTVELMPVAEFERTFNVNALGSLRVLKAAIPRLRGHGGRLLLVTSLWGRASGPMVGAYAATKHAIESLADTARRETAGMNLDIVVVAPGVVKTDMLSVQTPAVQKLIDDMPPQQRSLYGPLYQRYVKLLDGASAMAITVEQCAKGIEAALFARRPRTRYRIGTDSQILRFLARVLPDRWMDALMGLRLNNKPLETR